MGAISYVSGIVYAFVKRLPQVQWNPRFDQLTERVRPKDSSLSPEMPPIAAIPLSGDPVPSQRRIDQHHRRISMPS